MRTWLNSRGLNRQCFNGNPQFPLGVPHQDPEFSRFIAVSLHKNLSKSWVPPDLPYVHAVCPWTRPLGTGVPAAMLMSTGKTNEFEDILFVPGTFVEI